MLRGGVSMKMLRRLAPQHTSEGDFAAMELAELVHAAGEGDQEAWNAIVERFGGLVWATVRAHRLNAVDGAEVVQTTWLRLVEHLDRIRDPERLGGWLAATTRNECLRQIRHSAREVPSEMATFESGDDGSLDQSLLVAERDRAFWKAFGALGERCQTLLRVLMADAEPSYQEVSAALGMPIGAIGPTRQRCLERLRQDPQLAAFGEVR
jgi:RNA polymerase sigma factor (sigma-70 family)